MAFWSTEKFRVRQYEQCLIKPFDGLIRVFDDNRIKHGAYELSLGPEVFITADEDGNRLNAKKILTSEDPQIVIPPGQFGLLLTDEIISVPSDAIGFISMKAGIKLDGLINVSGFHVDPGFKGRLTFSVYNAGSRYIPLEYGKPTFLIWFADLDQPTSDKYDGKRNNQKEITRNDVVRLQGEVASPAELNRRLFKIEAEVAHYKTSFRWVVGIGGSILTFIIGRLVLKWLLGSVG
jgi:dCTP deaminase